MNMEENINFQVLIVLFFNDTVLKEVLGLRPALEKGVPSPLLLSFVVNERYLLN